LSKPEFEREVVVNFTAQDTDSSRKEYNSRKNLEKLIQKSLANTNWKLMSDGVTYRLGFLNGRLKGLEK